MGWFQHKAPTDPDSSFDLDHQESWPTRPLTNISQFTLHAEKQGRTNLFCCGHVREQNCDRLDLTEMIWQVWPKNRHLLYILTFYVLS